MWIYRQVWWHPEKIENISSKQLKEEIPPQNKKN